MWVIEGYGKLRSWYKITKPTDIVGKLIRQDKKIKKKNDCFDKISTKQLGYGKLEKVIEKVIKSEKSMNPDNLYVNMNI